MPSSREQLEALNRLYREVDAIYHDAAVSLGLSDSVFYILYALFDEDQSLTQNDLCKKWSLPKQTVNSAIRNLVREGHIRLENLPGTHNRKAICLTETGQQLVRDKILPIYTAECKALGRLSGDEFRTYLKLLSRHISYLREETERAAASVQENS